MSLDAGTNFVLQFRSIGAVKATARATEVGRAMNDVAMSMARVRTSMSQISGLAGGLSRLSGLNIGVAGLAGGLAGRIQGGGRGRADPFAQRLGDLTRSVVGLGGMLTVGLGLERLRGTAAFGRASMLPVANAARAGAAGRAAGAFLGAKGGAVAGVALGPIGMLVGSIVGFIAVDLVGRLMGGQVTAQSHAAFGTHRGISAPSIAAREHLFEQQAVMGSLSQAQRDRANLSFRAQRYRDIAEELRAGPWRASTTGASMLVGDAIAGFAGSGVASMLGIGAATRRFGPSSAVQKRVDELNRRIEQLEQNRSADADRLLALMRRANRL